MGLTAPVFSVIGNEISAATSSCGRRPFLIAKATHDIHDKLEGEGGEGAGRAVASFAGIIFKILCSTSCSRSIGDYGRGHGRARDHHEAP